MFVFFFNDTATTEIYTLSLHDALPIYDRQRPGQPEADGAAARVRRLAERQRARAEHLRPRVELDVDLEADDGLVVRQDRKSTRLNSSHANISYAVFCLKKKKRTAHTPI